MTAFDPDRLASFVTLRPRDTGEASALAMGKPVTNSTKALRIRCSSAFRG
jgi:hypothetical protein